MMSTQDNAQGITVLGSTGSIGTSTLDVIARSPERFEVIALTAHSNVDKLAGQCRQFRPRFAVIGDPALESRLRDALRDSDSETVAMSGPAALLEAVEHPAVDTVMAAIVGAAGLGPTLRAAECGHKVLLANKESMVIAGQLLMAAVRDSGATILPVDSEHNAVFQALPDQFDGLADHALEACGVERIILTASGGPFLNRTADELSNVTPQEACAHPNWDMGRKISVDSATLMNKGLELIEAHWLFGARPDQLDVLVHPQSIVHSMVCYRDGSVIAQMGTPDMRTPIAHTLAWPDRIESGVNRLDLASAGDLTFLEPDTQRFPSLELAYQAMKVGRNAPITLNAANEVAVESFLGGEIPFNRIAAIVSKVLDARSIQDIGSIDDIMASDRETRSVAMQFCRSEGK